MPPGPLPLRAVRNQDFREVSLEVEGRPVLRFAAVYGFRNIQTLMRKIKSGRCEYHYAEVMACPSGEEAAICAPPEVGTPSPPLPPHPHVLRIRAILQGHRGVRAPRVEEWSRVGGGGGCSGRCYTMALLLCCGRAEGCSTGISSELPGR